jgi:hypothetical protein
MHAGGGKGADDPATRLRTSVRPDGHFRIALHQASYRVANLRPHERVGELGRFADGRPVTNQKNFPAGAVDASETEGVFEIANPFPFRGTTYIGKSWADDKRRDPSAISLPPRPAVSMLQWIRAHCSAVVSTTTPSDLLKTMPEPVQLALAVNSTDPEDLILLAKAAGDFIYDTATGQPTGLCYASRSDGSVRPRIHNRALFEAVANNACLPDEYKDAMVLRPGAQGDSAIVGEWHGESGSHVFEYLRRNSYIPWGHYAANMANDAVRYQPEALTMADMTGMRHLYYQRTYVRLAEMIGMKLPTERKVLEPRDLESLRLEILASLEDAASPIAIPLNGDLWGWNLGFDYAPSRYRLHASHQQVHQQYALIPRRAPAEAATGDDVDSLPAYACGDLIHDFIRAYRDATGVDFFTVYIDAIRNNQRTDGRAAGPHELIVHRDANVMLFVPKAQTSQWELQLVTLAPVGNILEADDATRRSLDRALLTAVQTLGRMGARMITTIAYAKRFDAGDTGQHLLYSFLPRLPESPGAFSETQQRWIIGHYPEDFAAACRMHSPALASE